MKKYLGELLCNKIEAAFPRLLAKLRDLLRDANTSLSRLGGARTAPHLRRAYLDGIARKYEADAREAIDRPWLLDSVNARVRNLVKEANDNFGQRMRGFGHVYEFEDHCLREEDVVQRLRAILKPETVEAQPGGGPAHRPIAPVQQRDPPVCTSEELFAKIREEVRVCGCTVLPGLVHPDVIHRLYQDQTRKWRDLAEEHLQVVAAGVNRAAEEILTTVCPPGGSTGLLYNELLLVLRRFYDDSLQRALSTLRTYCEGDRTKQLQTTDPGFAYRLRLLQSVRLISRIDAACNILAANRKERSVEELELLLFSACHHSTADNTVNEVHDALKVYYEVIWCLLVPDGNQ